MQHNNMELGFVNLAKEEKKNVLKSRKHSGFRLMTEQQEYNHNMQ